VQARDRAAATAGAILKFRWLMHLTQIGFIVGDGDGNLDDPLTLSGKALDTIESVMAKADELREAVQ
jgi:hypothetical protein